MTDHHYVPLLNSL